MSNISNSFSEGSLYRCHFQQVKQNDRYDILCLQSFQQPPMHNCLLLKIFLDQGQPSHKDLQQARPPWVLYHLERETLPGQVQWGYLIPWNHHHLPHSDNHLIRFVSVCIHDFAHVTLCHCIGGSTLDMMWNYIIPLIDTLVNDLQFIESNLTFINKLVHSLISFKVEWC